MVEMVLMVFAFSFLIIYASIFFVLFLHLLVVTAVYNPCAALISACLAYACVRVLRREGCVTLPGGRIARRKDGECCICFDSRTDWVLPCAHKFHERCLSDWVHKGTAKSCPLCRAQIQ
jgi:hypothetical protein